MLKTGEGDRSVNGLTSTREEWQPVWLPSVPKAISLDLEGAIPHCLLTGIVWQSRVPSFKMTNHKFLTTTNYFHIKIRILGQMYGTDSFQTDGLYLLSLITIDT
ncbi:hypothetical protein J6590_044397 [Homalodisca vitripennis]|nr:hypothetical protein J6590_044397 [Homalodisca vitripennis]